MDDEVGSKGHPTSQIRTASHKRKFTTPSPEPLRRNLKRNCRDHDIKEKESDQTLSSGGLPAQPNKSTGDWKWRSKKQEHPSGEQTGPCESETRQKTSHNSEKYDSTAPSRTLESSKRGKKSGETSADNHRQRKTHKRDVDQEILPKDGKIGEQLGRDDSHCRTHDKDMERRIRKRRRIQDSLSAADSIATPHRRSLSLADADTSLPSGSSGPAGLNMPSSASAKPAASSAVMSRKSLVDEPLFDNSDDEFPELVIDVPTI